MKLKLDENLGELGRSALSAAGHDVSTIAMQDMSGSPDAAVCQTCRSEGRVLVTLDRDFGEVLRFPPEDTAGIAILVCRGRISPALLRRSLRASKSSQVCCRLWRSRVTSGLSSPAASGFIKDGIRVPD